MKIDNKKGLPRSRGSPSRQSVYLMVTVNVVEPVMLAWLLSAAEMVTV
jgi:hypothetical protein